MSSFVLKLLGIFFMLCDHISITFFGYTTFWNVLGRLSFPLFAFQITQGYVHTSNLKKYLLRLLIFACISQYPFYLFSKHFSADIHLNIFFTFLLGIIACLAFDKIKLIVLKLISIVGIILLGELIKVDYGWFGITIILVFYIFRNHKIIMSSSIILLVFLKYINTMFLPATINYSVPFFIATCLSLIPILLYNKKQGPKLKYLFYAFYPAHLLILAIIKQFM